MVWWECPSWWLQLPATPSPSPADRLHTLLPYLQPPVFLFPDLASLPQKGGGGLPNSLPRQGEEGGGGGGAQPPSLPYFPLLLVQLMHHGKDLQCFYKVLPFYRNLTLAIILEYLYWAGVPKLSPIAYVFNWIWWKLCKIIWEGDAMNTIFPQESWHTD